MSKLQVGSVKTTDESDAAGAFALSRRQLLAIAGQTAAAGLFAGCDAKEAQNPGQDLGMGLDLGSKPADLGSKTSSDLSSASRDLAPPADLTYVCMVKVATDAEALAVNDAKGFYDSEQPAKSFFVARDAAGFFALRNVCLHNGCQTAFNSVAKTYDCPCHGSRYNLDGTVLQGPTLAPLRSFPLTKRVDGMLEVDPCGPGSTDLSGRVV